MVNLINTLELDSKTSDLMFEHLGENVYSIKSSNGEDVIEVLSIDFDTKMMEIRHQHSVHNIVFKNDLDRVLDAMGIKRSTEVVNTDVKAPMPGKVIDIVVKEGDTVSKGDAILILEAMKMENVLKAENDCYIKKVLVSSADNVEKNQILVELDPLD